MTPPVNDTVVFRWSTEAAQRLVELQSGAVDGIDNVGTDDFEKVEGDTNLQLIERDPLNVFYVGFNRDMAPFDNERVRQAVGYAIDTQRIVDNFYPKGSRRRRSSCRRPSPATTRASRATPTTWPRPRSSWPRPATRTASTSTPELPRRGAGLPAAAAGGGHDLQAQLAEVGIRVTLDLQESGTFIDNANAGNLPFYLLGWGADYPDATNFLDYHFGAGASPQFGAGFPDIHELLAEAGPATDQDARNELYAEAAELIKQHVPMIPVAHGGSATAYKATVESPQASPLSNEQFAVIGVEGQDQFVWMQNGEPIGLYCADETDGETLRVCEQIDESLLSYEVDGTEVDARPGRELRAQRRPHGVDLHAARRRQVPRRLGPSTPTTSWRTYRAQWDAEIRATSDGTATSPTSRPSSAAS